MFLPGFSVGPSFLNQEGGASRSGRDWFRYARHKHKLMESSNDPSQTRITDHMRLLDEVQYLLNKNKQLSDLICKQSIFKPELSASPTSELGSLLQKMLKNIQNNSGKHASQRRHDAVIKKFATALYILSGSMAYEFIQQNLPQALPSLRTVQTIVQTQYSHIEEGVFRYKELVEHLNKHDLPYLVSIAEDATRIINRIEYDPQTNRCVGFVLPLGDDGRYKVDAHQATSFEAIQEMFQKVSIAKYAYLYAAQPLKEGAPSFCLACVGTNNKFTALQVLKIWNYIHSELQRYGIHVINFAADGDSRLLRAMRVTMNMVVDPLASQYNLNRSLNHQKLSDSLSKWLYVKQVPTVLCVQDTVHIGVKLKSRLLKPSITLPLGRYIATSSHLAILMKTVGREKHGLRCKDLNHQDKQNFDAVENIINASHLLDSMPDAVGTKQYIGIMHSVVNSYLDKSLKPEQRLQDIWYSVFFLRYWRQWVLSHPKFNLINNFITSNTYMCVEINAHALLMCLINLKEKHNSPSSSFVPWNFGSQSCERMFRALRSMTSTFSTVINFSMMGILQRLNKLYIQEELHSHVAKEEHGIRFPRQEVFGRKKDGSRQYTNTPISEITEESLVAALKRAEIKAQESMELLGMACDLQKSNKWNTPPLADYMIVIDEKSADEDSDDEGNEEPDENNEDILINNAENVLEDLEKLQSCSIINESVKQKAKKAILPLEGLPQQAAAEVTIQH